MADEAGLIYVRALEGLNVRPNEHRVVLNEFDDRHPGGQAFVFGPDPVQVFETPGVTNAIRMSTIEKVSDADGKKFEQERRERAEAALAQNDVVRRGSASDSRVNDVLTRENQLTEREQALQAEQTKLDMDKKELQRQMDAFAAQQKGAQRQGRQ